MLGKAFGSAPGQQLPQIRTSNELKQRYACAMAAAIEDAANVKPSTLRVRRHRERRREGLCCFTVRGGGGGGGAGRGAAEDAIARGI